MAEVPKAAISMQDFPGLQLELDEFDLPAGATHHQTNFVSECVGRLRSRRGYVVVSFETSAEDSLTYW